MLAQQGKEKKIYSVSITSIFHVVSMFWYNILVSKQAVIEQTNCTDLTHKILDPCDPLALHPNWT
jgi:hypothetical protein